MPELISNFECEQLPEGSSEKDLEVKQEQQKKSKVRATCASNGLQSSKGKLMKHKPSKRKSSHYQQARVGEDMAATEVELRQESLEAVSSLSATTYDSSLEALSGIVISNNNNQLEHNHEQHLSEPAKSGEEQFEQMLEETIAGKQVFYSV